MIELTYDARVVLALFTQAKPGKLNPSSADIEKFNRDLKSAFEDALKRIMAKPDIKIPFNVGTKSQILAYRPNMPGADEVQIENACKFFKNTADIFGSGGSGTESLRMPAPMHMAAPKKKTARKKAVRKKAVRKKAVIRKKG